MQEGGNALPAKRRSAILRRDILHRCPYEERGVLPHPTDDCDQSSKSLEFADKIRRWSNPLAAVSRHFHPEFSDISRVHTPPKSGSTPTQNVAAPALVSCVSS